jgi:hypothetical protein
MKRQERQAAGIDALLNGSRADTGKPKSKAGRKRTNYRVPDTASERGTKEGETRFSGIVSKELLQKVKAIAYWQRVPIKQVLEEALATHVQYYESRTGSTVPPIPKNK